MFAGRRLIGLAALSLTLSGCFQKGISLTSSAATGAGGVQISWNASKETAVNSTGGGYKVTYTLSGGSPTTVDVPYAGGAVTPNTILLPPMASGTYSLTVTAYSALNPTGATSAPASFTVGGH